MITALEAPAWRLQAACRDANPDLFFPDEDLEPALLQVQVEAAKQVCKGCPVRDECLQSGIDSGATFGIYGGKDFGAPDFDRARDRTHTADTHVDWEKEWVHKQRVAVRGVLRVLPAWRMAIVEDLTSDAIERALRNSDQYEQRGKGSHDEWLKNIAYRRAVDQVRQEALPHYDSPGDTATAVDEAIAAQQIANPSAEWLSKFEELVAAIYHTTDGANPKYFDAFLQVYAFGRTYKDAAAITGQSLGGTFINGVTRAMEAIRERFGIRVDVTEPWDIFGKSDKNEE